MGAGRAGWYSWDAIDNGGTPSATSIMPAFQTVVSGDVMPAVPGAKFRSSGSLSPGTGAALRELGSSVITSVGEAHPEMKKAIVKNEAVEKATRLIMGTNLIRGKFDASSGVQ